MNPIGTLITDDPIGDKVRYFTIIGVMKDFASRTCATRSNQLESVTRQSIKKMRDKHAELLLRQLS